MYQLNTLGALRVTQAVLPGMRARGAGQIVFVSSILSRLTIPLIGAYAHSKWALEAIAETLAFEGGPLGIAVTVLEPGMVATDGPCSAANHEDSTRDYAGLWEQLRQMPALWRSLPKTSPARLPTRSTPRRRCAARSEHSPRTFSSGSIGLRPTPFDTIAAMTDAAASHPLS